MRENPIDVMLSGAKHLAFSGCCEGEILRLRLRMTLRHSRYAEEIHELSEQMGLDGKVKWTGEYAWDSHEASVYLRSADICVLPFDTGVQLNNSSFAAAVAHGLPIVTTQGKTVEEPFVHLENVFLCPPKSPEVMAEAIKTLMDKLDLRERLSTGSLKLAEKWFSWERAIENTVGTFS